jgi:hypothetical protein
MPQCDNCGFRLPEGAEYCPNCGAPVKRRTEVRAPSPAAIGRILQAGVIGAFVSILISSFSPSGLDLYFIPSFVSSLIAIYLSRARRLDEALAIALAVYLFADGIVAGIALGTLYAQDVPLADLYGNYVPTLVDVIMYTANPITAVIAGYIGVRLTSRGQERRPPPITYGRREEPGGVIYSLEANRGEKSPSSPHKV